nr:MAG TPA: hypothetical protein [Caudoviricetes sp.]
MDYLCTAHGVVHIRIGWNRLVPDHPFFIPKNPPRSGEIISPLL